MDDDPAVRMAKVRRLTRTGVAKEERQRHRLSLQDMADPPVNVSPVTVWRWENGHRVPHGDAALRYLDRLEQLAEESSR